MTDEELTDAWEAAVLGRGIRHEEHVRIGRVLVLRHGRDEATTRLVEGTRRNAGELFDEELTRRWSVRIADAVEADAGAGFDAFAAAHPDLLRGDLLGVPAWRRAQARTAGCTPSPGSSAGI